MLRSLLIDDEPPARADLRERLAAHPEVRLVDEAGTLSRARALLARDDYDLVFLDIQLRGGSGFDLVPHVRPEARVIFVTAFNDHALRAFEVNALDYLLKPISPTRLAAAVARCMAIRRLDAAFSSPTRDSQTVPADPAPSVAASITDLVHLRLDGDRQRFVPLADLAAVISDENYSAAWLASGERLFVRKTMKAWEALLPPSHFVRVHRQAIMNVAHLRAIVRSTDDTSLLTLQGCPEPLRASYRYLPELRARLAAIGRKV